jgi:alkaline phosphatase D
VMFAPQSPAGKPTVSNDSWDGYRAARTRVFEAAAGAGVKHLVVLTGDVHSAWAYDLARDPFDKTSYDPRTGKGAVGTEIVTPAVTSPGGPPPDRVAGLLDTRPHLKYVLGQQRGYTILDVTRDRLQADWWFIPSITERSDAETFGKGLVSEAAAPHLVAATGPSASRSAADFAPDLR